MPELKPGVGRVLFARLAQEQQKRTRMALVALAQVIERQAKINLTGYTHKYGTPTPAPPGTAPALISVNLRRSITHTPVARVSYGWMVRIGTATGFYPTYTTKTGGAVKGKTAAHVYGYILEVEGTRAGNTFPFLKPAFEFGVRIAAPVIFHEKYGTGWTRLP